MTEVSGNVVQKLLEATRNDALGWNTVDAESLGPQCMVGYGRFDWQAHVPEEIRSLWGELPLTARLVAYLIAREAAYFDDPPVA